MPYGLFVAVFDLFVAFFRISDILTSAHWLPHRKETGCSPFCTESQSHSENNSDP
jgi:hypothetical protein